MMPSRRTLVLAVGCVGLALLAIATRPIAVSQPAPARWPAFSKLTRFEVSRTGQPTAVLVRVGASWRIEDGPADSFAIEAVADALAQPVVLDPLSTSDDLGRYALTDDALTVDLGDGARWHLGKVSDGRHTFARRPGETLVYRARSKLRRAFDRPAASWREHRLFVGRGPSDVARLEMHRGQTLEWAATRAEPDEAWRFEHPPTDDAGQAELHAVSNTLSTSKAERFVGGSDFRAITRLRATTFSGETFGLEMGARQGDGSATVRRLSDGVVARLPKHLMTFLDVRQSELRDRRVFSFDESELLQIRHGDLWIERRADGWWATRPRTVALERDAAKLLTDAIVHLRAAGFPEPIPPRAFDAPFGELHLLLSEGRTLSLTFGEPWGKAARLVRASDRPGRVFALSNGTVSRVMPTLAALRLKPAFSP